jgi:hypothetical protein
VGALVFVTLVEPAKYSLGSYPSGFPWQPPVSSDTRVLARIPICRSARPSTLRLTVHAFRALKAGQDMIVAALTPRWKAAKTGLPRFVAKVIVRS